MKNLIFCSSLLLLSGASYAGEFEQCPQFFAGGKPPEIEKRENDTELCNEAFAVLHSGSNKAPVFTAERLNSQLVSDALGEKRAKGFAPDPRIPSGQQAKSKDYAGSGFDKGHMTPAGNMPTPSAMVESFRMTNIVPQAPAFNRGVWAKYVESGVRKYASRASGDIYVITAPIYAPNSPSIGNGVRVPQYLMKLVYDPSANKAWAYWMDNDDSTTASPTISYEEVVKRTGIRFIPAIPTSTR